MGPGDRLEFDLTNGIGLGVYFSRAPYERTIYLNILFFRVRLGFGRPYTDPDYLT